MCYCVYHSINACRLQFPVTNPNRLRAVHFRCGYKTDVFCFFSLEQPKKAPQSTEGKMGNKNLARSMENLLASGGKDKPRGLTVAAESKEKPGRHCLRCLC